MTNVIIDVINVGIEKVKMIYPIGLINPPKNDNAINAAIKSAIFNSIAQFFIISFINKPLNSQKTINIKSLVA